MKMRFFRQLRMMLLITICFTTTPFAAHPLWTFTPDPNYPPQIAINPAQTTSIVYSVQNNAHKNKHLVIKSIPGVVQSLPCFVNPIGQPGSSCFLVLAITGNALAPEGVHNGPILCEANSNGTPNSNQCYQPSPVNQLNITVNKPSAGVTINVNPFILLMEQNSTGTITVTNNSTSSAPANNVIATIPGGSGITVQSTTCGASLAVGASCTITFASTIQEGPTTIPVKGDNTNTANVYAAVINNPLISITGPVQQSRIVPTDGVTILQLQVSNDPDSLFNALNINVSDKTSCPLMAVDASNCLSVAPGASCHLDLTTITPYAPCTIAISGTNTGNTPTTSIAFSHLGGLVFQTTGANGKVVIDAASEFISTWTSPSQSGIAGAFSDTDGESNTNAIVVNPACTGQAANCAAFSCRAIGPQWYLPARKELRTVISALCPSSTFPCAFGSFLSTFYWSSTQWFADTNAYTVDVPDTNFGPTNKSSSHPVRCIQSY